MGAGYSNAVDHAEKEFVQCLELLRQEAALHDERRFVQSSISLDDVPGELSKLSKRYDTPASPNSVITYHHLVGFTFPDGFQVDVGHPAVLYVLDADKDGLFSWQDVLGFVQWIENNVPHDRVEGKEFNEAVHARCVLHLWRGIGGERIIRQEEAHKAREVARRRLPSTHVDPNTGITSLTNGPLCTSSSDEGGGGEEGEEECPFEDWMLLFLRANFSPEDPRFPDTLTMPAIAAVHTLLGIYPSYRYNLHEFCLLLDEREVERFRGSKATLRRAQRSKGATAEDLDALKAQAVFRVPVRFVKEFLRSFIQAYVGVLHRFGLATLL